MSHTILRHRIEFQQTLGKFLLESLFLSGHNLLILVLALSLVLKLLPLRLGQPYPILHLCTFMSYVCQAIYVMEGSIPLLTVLLINYNMIAGLSN